MAFDQALLQAPARRGSVAYELPLETGCAEFRFVLNGQRWCPRQASLFQSTNSLIWALPLIAAQVSANAPFPAQEARAMITRRRLLAGSAATLLAPLAVGTASAQTPPARITVLYDAFGKPSNLKRGWGYAALIEYGGRRMLFDTGAKGADLAYNVDALGIDLKKLDFVVISHRHNDHTAGLHYVLRENPGITIYTPVEGAAFDLPTAPATMNLIKRYVASVPDELRYFGGNPPSEIRYEPPWAGARFVQIRETTEVLPGVFIFSTRSETPGTREMNEIALVIKTPKGGVLVVGCSHPGIEKMLETATKIDPQVYAVFGGFHLVDVSDARVTEIVSGFRDKWKIERMAAGHCTGQFAFGELVRIYGANFDLAGVGSVIALTS